jgi:hypothetical protein
MKAGVIEFLVKPFSEEDLLKAIGQAIKRDEAARYQRAQMGDLGRGSGAASIQIQNTNAHQGNGIFLYTQNIYILCFFDDTALSSSWLARPGWTSQEHGIMF